MQRQNKIHFISSADGDWIGMYVDGVLQSQGHSLDIKRVLADLGFEVISETKDEAWFDKHGYCCPQSLDDDKR